MCVCVCVCVCVCIHMHICLLIVALNLTHVVDLREQHKHRCPALELVAIARVQQKKAAQP